VLGLLNLLWLAFFLFPFYVQTISVLKTPAEADSGAVLALPQHPTLHNVQAVLASPTYRHALLNSTVVATATTVLALMVGMWAAYALARLPLPGKRVILVLILLLVAMPPIALVPSLYLMFLHLRLIDTYVALIAADLALILPFTMWVLTVHFRNVPASLIDQAEIDGCTPLQTLWRVVVPLATPGLVACGLLSFIMVWNEFIFALTLTTTIKTETLTVIVGGYGGGELWTASEVVAVPIVVLALIGQRGIVRGLTAGALNA
jgi:trehalose/maltose transport system permease protein